MISIQIKITKGLAKSYLYKLNKYQDTIINDITSLKLMSVSVFKNE